jgi:hypothetical protein
MRGGLGDFFGGLLPVETLSARQLQLSIPVLGTAT